VNQDAYRVLHDGLLGTGAEVRTMKLSRQLLPFLLLLALSFAGSAFAQEPTTDVADDDVNRVARELYCPICENTPLDVCETQACEDWRQLIREKLTAGQSDEEIIAYFADVYGERARATPATEGFSLIVWIAPLVLAAVAVVVFARLLKGWLARGAAAEAATAPSATPDPSDMSGDEAGMDEYVARLEQEVRDSS
jgi:cytochrome c-type biogenesis protein CcmH